MRITGLKWARFAVVAASVALIGGAANSAASTTEACSSGRPFCVAITDGDGVNGKVSLSTVTSPHYMKYEVTIRRRTNPASTSNLTNGKMTLTLTDLVGGTAVPSTAVYQAAASTLLCSAGSGSASHVLTCTVPNLPAGATPLDYKPLIFKTPSTAAKSTTMTAEASFKEKGNDRQPGSAQQDTVIVPETTTYEELGDLDTSWAFPNAVIGLATSSGDDQFSSFPLTIPAANPSFAASLEEGPVLPTGFCPTCFGEIVTTVGGTIFSSTSPIELISTLNFLPSGKNSGNIVVRHKRDGVVPLEIITEPCNVAAGDVPPAGDLPCRDVEIDHLPGGAIVVTIRSFASGNGGWGFG